MIDTALTRHSIRRVTEELVLYVKKWCPWCVEAKQYLDQHGYRYREVDVLANPADFAEMRRVSGQSSAPTLVIGSKVLPDFGTPELVTFLKAEGILPPK